MKIITKHKKINEELIEGIFDKENPDTVVSSDGVTITRTQNRANELLRVANEAEKVADIAENKGDFNKANLLRTRAKELRQVAQAGLASETADLDKQRKLINGGVEVEDEEDPKQPQQPSNSENNTAEDDKHNKDAETQYDAPQKDGTKKSTNSRQSSDINDSDSSDDGQNDPNNNDNKSNQTDSTKDVKGNNKDSDTSNNNTDNKSSTDNEDDDKNGAGPGNPPTNQKKSDDDEEDESNNGESNDDETDGGPDKQTNGEGNNSSDPLNQKMPDDEQENPTDNPGNGDDGGDDDPSGKGGTSSQNSKNKIVKNPFSQKEIGQRGTPQQLQSNVELDDPDLKDIISMLKHLKGRAKEGAIDGLKSMLTKNESLNEAINIHKASDDDFNAYVNDTIALINQIRPIKTTPEKNRDLIKDFVDDKFTNDIFNQEEEQEFNRRQQLQRAREREAQKYAAGSDAKLIAKKIAAMVKTQIPEEDVEHDSSWTKFNSKAYSRGILKKGEFDRTIEETPAVEIVLFFDMSGSWADDRAAIKAGEEIVGALGEMEANGELKVDVWYFSDDITQDRFDSCLGWGTGAWSDIVDKVAEYRQECRKKGMLGPNVVILTDKDMNGDAQYKKLVTDGYIWLLYSIDPGKCQPITDACIGRAGKSVSKINLK